MLGLVLLASVVPLLVVMPADAVEVWGYIGCHRRTFAAAEIRGSASYSVDPSSRWLAITEVYHDTPAPVEYAYEVRCDGKPVHTRRHTSTGFGPVTCFASLPRGASGKITIRRAAGSVPVLISAVRGVRQSEADALLAADRFTLMGLVPMTGDPARESELAALLAEKLGSRRRYGIDRGFAYEVRFANDLPERVREQLAACSAISRRHGLPAMLGMVTWWSGTPLGVPDGLGGKFGDLQYQQVCYAPDHEHPEDPALRELMGDRYNPHYGLSVPNQWSSTPWLTMNSPMLNEYRYRRLGEALAMLDEVGLGKRGVYGIYLENEPRYWDTACEASNDRSGRLGKTLWADFNPLVIKDAQEDGVILDPSDGLSAAELSWLHRNVGAYNQGIVDATHRAMPSLGALGWRLYTHSLQHVDMFPGGGIRHSAAEWAYADGARTGLEGMWSQPSDYERVREWGRWANINREENDGRHIDEHLWDLRVTYMMGGDVYNSYNWNAIGAQRFFDYVDEFLQALPAVELQPTEAVKRGSSIEFRTPAKLQAFSGVQVRVGSSGAFEGTAWLTVHSPRYGEVTSAPVEINAAPGESTLRFEFPTPAQTTWEETSKATLRLIRADRPKAAREELFFTQASAETMKLSLDLRAQRALSLWAIANTTAASR